ncbi:ABC transporter permease [Flavisolibacter ginsenosidimutans]|uniref:ABC transporter permease n=1 Tax=Flavisolibacter ginsenosidimutans TaxID=661481 RepID=A0A5B8UI37_9BACT|nr:ABC transporter permease [Flavisolibacter ginsenosidimutans]QEC56026.1 ABC transporter permease [Flavisolibacter ginsenosidimutans]
MLHLLKIEWLKIKNYRAFWVFGVLYLVSIFLINYIAWKAHQRTVEAMPASEQILGNPFAFPKVWQTVGWMSSWLLYFPGMIIIMLMVNEFNFKTHRQNIIDGLSRQQFIGVKILLCVIMAVLITIINVITGFVFGSMSQGSFSWEGFENIGYVFLQAIAYIFFALMLAVLFRRSGLAIIVFILYGLIFEWLATALMTFNFHMAPYGYFFPLQVTDVMLPIPFGKKVFYPDTPAIGVLIAALAVYLFAYVFFTRRKFVTDDL